MTARAPVRLRKTGKNRTCTFIFLLMSVTWLLHQEGEGSTGVLVGYRLDGNLFNSRRLQATAMVKTVNVVE